LRKAILDEEERKRAVKHLASQEEVV
jgi:hypothetical protein